MTVKTHDQIHGPAADEAWALYRDAFGPLDAYAVQRHLMTRKEFDHVMDDRAVAKYVSYDGDEMRGLATFTNDLSAMPLVSPAYFARRWPQHYAERRIWYCGFVAVHPDHRGAGAFGELVEEMYLVAARNNGIIGLDVCGYNDGAHRLSRIIGLMLHRIGGPGIEELSDVQTYRLYVTPGAAA